MSIEANEVIESNAAIEEFFVSLNNFSKETVFIANNPIILEKIKEHNFECYSILIAKGMEFSKVVVVKNELNDVKKIYCLY